MAEEVVDPLVLRAGELLGEADERGVAVAHAGAHHLVVAGRVGLVLEHQVVAVGGEQLHVRVPHRLQGVLAVGGPAPLAVLGGGALERAGDPFEGALQRREEQLALVAEQREHVRLGHPDAARDALHRGAVQAAVGELVHGGRRSTPRGAPPRARARGGTAPGSSRAALDDPR